jgi:hypothetical protein
MKREIWIAGIVDAGVQCVPAHVIFTSSDASARALTETVRLVSRNGVPIDPLVARSTTRGLAAQVLQVPANKTEAAVDISFDPSDFEELEGTKTCVEVDVIRGDDLQPVTVPIDVTIVAFQELRDGAGEEE